MAASSNKPGDDKKVDPTATAGSPSVAEPGTPTPSSTPAAAPAASGAPPSGKPAPSGPSAAGGAPPAKAGTPPAPPPKNLEDALGKLRLEHYRILQLGRKHRDFKLQHQLYSAFKFDNKDAPWQAAFSGSKLAQDLKAKLETPTPLSPGLEAQLKDRCHHIEQRARHVHDLALNPGHLERPEAAKQIQAALGMLNQGKELLKQDIRQHAYAQAVNKQLDLPEFKDKPKLKELASKAYAAAIEAGASPRTAALAAVAFMHQASTSGFDFDKLGPQTINNLCNDVAWQALQAERAANEADMRGSPRSDAVITTAVNTFISGFIRGANEAFLVRGDTAAQEVVNSHQFLYGGSPSLLSVLQSDAKAAREAALNNNAYGKLATPVAEFSGLDPQMQAVLALQTNPPTPKLSADVQAALDAQFEIIDAEFAKRNNQFNAAFNDKVDEECDKISKQRLFHLAGRPRFKNVAEPADPGGAQALAGGPLDPQTEFPPGNYESNGPGNSGKTFSVKSDGVIRFDFVSSWLPGSEETNLKIAKEALYIFQHNSKKELSLDLLTDIDAISHIVRAAIEMGFNKPIDPKALDKFPGIKCEQIRAQIHQHNQQLEKDQNRFKIPPAPPTPPAVNNRPAATPPVAGAPPPIDDKKSPTPPAIPGSTPIVDAKAIPPSSSPSAPGTGSIVPGASPPVAAPVPHAPSAAAVAAPSLPPLGGLTPLEPLPPLPVESKEGAAAPSARILPAYPAAFVVNYDAISTTVKKALGIIPPSSASRRGPTIAARPEGTPPAGEPYFATPPPGYGGSIGAGRDPAQSRREGEPGDTLAPRGRIMRAGPPGPAAAIPSSSVEQKPLSEDEKKAILNQIQNQYSSPVQAAEALKKIEELEAKTSTGIIERLRNLAVKPDLMEAGILVHEIQSRITADLISGPRPVR